MGEKIKIVIVGCGAISKGWFTAAVARPDAEIVGVVDLRREAAEKRVEEFQLKHAVVGTDLGQTLDKTRPDVLFNCTTPEAHAPTTLLAFDKGCHVLSEKPLADTMENARRMVAAAEKAGKLYAVMQNRRYMPDILRLRQFLQSGAIGPVTTIQSNFFIGAHFGGFRERMKHVLLLDMAIHTFDAARFLSGADARTAYCHEWNPEGSWYDHDASAVAIFEMTGGLVYVYQGSWCSEGLATPWEAHWRVIGQKGSAVWDGTGNIVTEAVTETGGMRSKVTSVLVPPFVQGSGKIGAHAGCINDYLDCLKSGEAPGTLASDNIKSLAMVHGAIRSADEQRKVRMDEL